MTFMWLALDDGHADPGVVVALLTPPPPEVSWADHGPAMAPSGLGSPSHNEGELA
jgi:hypothetical protein